MRFVAKNLAFISNAVALSFLVVLSFLIAGPIAFAGSLPGPACPPDFACFLDQPRDGACQHPAIVLDEQIKSTRYEGDPFSRTYEKACIAKTGSLATRQGTVLRLKFGNGATKSYRDQNAACKNGFDPSCKTYSLYDFFPEHSLFLVNVGYNENQAWYLVKQADGTEQKIIAPPRYSPDRKWLASVYDTDGGDDGNNGIDIFPSDLDPARSGFHYRPKDYEQWAFAGWTGDDHLLLKVTRRVGDYPEPVELQAEVARVKGEWQLKMPPPTSPRP